MLPHLRSLMDAKPSLAELVLISRDDQGHFNVASLGRTAFLKEHAANLAQAIGRKYFGPDGETHSHFAAPSEAAKNAEAADDADSLLRYLLATQSLQRTEAMDRVDAWLAKHGRKLADPYEGMPGNP